MKKYDFVPYRGIDSKDTCPNCRKSHHFTRFYDTDTGDLLPPEYGKCDNEIKCGYVKTPYKHPTDKRDNDRIDLAQIKNKSIHYNTMDESLLTESLSWNKLDNFSKFLYSRFEKIFSKEHIKDILNKYQIGYSKLFGGGSTVFWQISRGGEIRGGKVIKYSKKGKRIKKPYPKITWIHSAMKKDFTLKQCFYGENLVTKKTKTVCIVEGEKTAIICSLFYPKFVWLGAGNLNGINEEKLKAIKDKNLVLYPDKGGAHTIWQKKMEKFSQNLELRYKIPTFVERQSEIGEGEDLADYLLKTN